jgi:hypothetical protein
LVRRGVEFAVFAERNRHGRWMLRQERPEDLVRRCQALVLPDTGPLRSRHLRVPVHIAA